MSLPPGASVSFLENMSWVMSNVPVETFRRAVGDLVSRVNKLFSVDMWEKKRIWSTPTYLYIYIYCICNDNIYLVFLIAG